ncbi:MAG: hypothetical protein U9R60_16820 [Bacteroidota bacterium]|nr:hypothetical protein [Bacteroidota bacterium]
MKRKIVSDSGYRIPRLRSGQVPDAGSLDYARDRFRMQDIWSAHRSPFTVHLLAFIFLVFTNVNVNGQTHVIAHLNEKLPESGNIIYCSSFEHAWKELSDNVLKDEVRLQKSISLQGNLNRSYKTAAYSPNCTSDSRFTNHGDSIIINSSFQESLEWPVEFQSFGHPMRFYTGEKEYTRCEYFGINLKDHEDLLKYNAQVKVVEFVNEDGFIVRLQARCRMQDTGYRMNEEWGKKEMSMRFIATRTEYGWVEIIIAKVPRERTLLKTIENVEKRINKPTTNNQQPTTNPYSTSTTLIPGDILAIPKINLNVNKEYGELLGKHLANRGFEKYFFAMAQQNINFEMDEQGARAGSEAKIVLKKGPSARRMVIDGPFLIYLKEYGAAKPYLAMWIENTECLVMSSE